MYIYIYIDRERDMNKTQWRSTFKEVNLEGYHAKNEDGDRQESREHRATPFLGDIP